VRNRFGRFSDEYLLRQQERSRIEIANRGQCPPRVIGFKVLDPELNRFDGIFEKAVHGIGAANCYGQEGSNPYQPFGLAVS